MLMKIFAQIPLLKAISPAQFCHFYANYHLQTTTIHDNVAALKYTNIFSLQRETFLF